MQDQASGPPRPTAPAESFVIAGLPRTVAELPAGRDGPPRRFGSFGRDRPDHDPRPSAGGSAARLPWLPWLPWLPLLSWLVVGAVVLLALSAGMAMLDAHAAAPGRLWVDVHHDRNGHFGFGLDLALALRGSDPVAFLSQLAKAVVWPPLHGLLLAAVLTVGGPDDRLGILPSLAGWTATVVLTAVLARRLFDDAPGGIPPAARAAAGSVAAAVAGALALASPAFGLLGADVMLEALGAAWSALALLCFARAMDTPREPWPWRLLGLVLTVLFFHKGNYWGLVTASLAIAFVIERRAEVATLVGAVLSAARKGFGAVFGVLGRDPLLVAAFAIVVLIAAIYRRGPTSLDLFGRSVSLYPPENLVTVAYVLVFARAVVAWRRHRDWLAPALGAGGRALLAWHVLPVAVSFLIPKRLSAFLWFVGPSNAPSGAPYDPLGAAAYYWAMLADGFHADPVVAVLVVVLLAVGLAGMRRFPPGGRAVLVLALVGTFGVIMHPYHQGRFLASWLFAAWVGAGAGAGLLVELLARRWSPARSGAAGTIVLGAGMSAAVLAAAVLVRPPPSATALAAASRYAGPSSLSLVTPALPALAGARSIGVAATLGRTPFFAWAIHVACGCAVPVDGPWLVGGGSRAANRAAMEAFLAATPADRLLVVDVAPGNPGVLDPAFAGLVDAMATQTRFVPLFSAPVAEHGATLTVWRRREPGDAPVPVPAASGPTDSAPAPAPAPSDPALPPGERDAAPAAPATPAAADAAPAAAPQPSAVPPPAMVPAPAGPPAAAGRD
jgi:hypothetical protein